MPVNSTVGALPVLLTSLLSAPVFALCSTNTTNTQEVPQTEQQSSKPSADSLLAQLGHLNLAGLDTAPSADSTLRLSQKKRSNSTHEQHLYARSTSEHAALQQLCTSGYFSMQFLEPPNSHAPSGQLVHPALASQQSSLRNSAAASAAAAGGDKVMPLASMPHNTSLIKAGAPMINTHGVSPEGSRVLGRLVDVPDMM